ncbi:MAG TPA: S46 family peptidase [Niabella sp.]|nr:S46 family peptidase [Niabella sp.]HOZ95417.1 S46 family peptidase [Niabella sp.]HQW14306.1 S46 family peptidase [Niabella sp.]HQX18414.1 S46 family peptidase [Niabella sp.]HQX40094.1 S46 family peptidase [Niabella sp.]
MKKNLLFLLLVITISLKSIADEGMWLPHLLGQQVYSDMVKKGLKLSKEQLYSMNKNSLKDAIIIFGGGCTGEIVSPEGLIFTNHHCGYGAIASASTVDHNYLRDGFYARSKSEEIKTALTVQFLLRIEDVTKEVESALANLSGSGRAAKQSDIISSINKRLSNGDKNIECRVSPLFKGNQYLAFVYEIYKDIRLVGTPPETVGKFGGDTDNWEWPRHTGDFSIFRVYANKNNQPATYDASNVPLKPKWYLPVSIKGVKENDFAMIWGYPGSTNRYESSYGIKLSTDVNNPSLVKLREVRLKYMLEEMKKDPAVKLKLASSFASIANYWKFFDGETKQLLKYDIYGQKQSAEKKFNEWANGKAEYQQLFADWGKAYQDWKPYAKSRVYLNEGIMGSPLLAFAGTLQQLLSSLQKPGADIEKIKKELDTRRKAFVEGENKKSDENILAAVLQMYYEDIDKTQQPTAFYKQLQQDYGMLDQTETYKKFAADVFKTTMIFDNEKWKTFISNPSAYAAKDDPAILTASAFINNYLSKYNSLNQKFVTANNEYGRLYLKGVLAMNPEKAKMMYPDATFTMRASYGQVKSYKPKDATFYDYVTTSKGILEKYIAGDYEFDLPANQIELLRKKDFGQYADPVRKDLVVNFITTNDITGGNSGSPVINGKGELIGLAFDGNYEALSHKLAFDKDLNRTINVDIRYVLWCIDKLGGATNIINELKLVK